jgi:hypothetical protein
VWDRFDRSAHFRTSNASDNGVSSSYKLLSRPVMRRLPRLFTSVEIKIERSVFGYRSKILTEPTHFRTLWMRSDQTPPMFQSFTECVFLQTDRSDQTDRPFRTHPECTSTLYLNLKLLVDWHWQSCCWIGIGNVLTLEYRYQKFRTTLRRRFSSTISIFLRHLDD